MANWQGQTTNLDLVIFDILSTASDDVTAEYLLDALVGSAISNMKKIDDFAGKAAVKPISSTPGNLTQFDANQNIDDSGARITTTMGTDNTTVPTSAANISYITERELLHTNYQGYFDYFGSQTQVQSTVATAGQTAIAYLGGLSSVASVQRGTYDGANWVFVNVVPERNNGMWIFARQILGVTDTPFGIVVYKDDRVNPPAFDIAEFPLLKPDRTDIDLDINGELTLTTKATAGSYGESANRNLGFGDTFKATQTTIDAKGRTNQVTERVLTLPNLPLTDGERKTVTVTPISNIATLDLSMGNGNIFKVSPSANTTIALSNATLAANTLKEFEVHITLGATAYAITWFGGITWLDDVPTLSANKTAVCVFRMSASGVFQGNMAYEF